MDFDLLGDPIPEGFGKRGRPAHVPSDEKRRLVIVLCAFDKTEEHIAAALAISVPTLKRYYFRELKAKAEARARLDAKLFVKLLAEVEAGNVSAIDKMFKRLDRHDMGGGLISPRPVKAKAAKLGKKEQLNVDAANVPPGGTWNQLLN